jgi:uncharacterized membrane protein YgdD (TMEM256/DUF423 family)
MAVMVVVLVEVNDGSLAAMVNELVMGTVVGCGDLICRSFSLRRGRSGMQLEDARAGSEVMMAGFELELEVKGGGKGSNGHVC